MQKNIGVAFALLCAAFCATTVASAHQVEQYEIGGVPYEIVIGSLGEPVIVDDKTGLDLEMIRDGKPLVGAQDSLQVELIAGNKKKIDSLSPVWGADGRYKNTFFPTVATTLSYRIFGTLENTPVDLTFTCQAAGHAEMPANTERKEMSVGVVRTKSEGAFGCPQSKEAFGFPEPAPQLMSLNAKRPDMPPQERVDQRREKDVGTMQTRLLMSIAGLLCVALIGIAAVMYRRKTPPNS